MPRSFGIVEYKLAETDFFLDKVIKCGKAPFDWRGINFYFSAFLTSARSITFAIQASISSHDELLDNYRIEQEKLKNNPEARFFVEARNLSEKVGYYPITGGVLKQNENGEHEMICFFDTWPNSELQYVPNEDVVTVSKRFFVTLLKAVQTFYIKCGKLIDFEKYYTLENLTAMGVTIEDVEEEIGFPRGYTNIPGATEEERIRAIRDSQASETPDWIFYKYLGQNRFGDLL